MKWKQWKLGLLVAILTGVFSGGVVAFVAPIIGLKEIIFIIMFNICQNAMLFLKDHPADKITSDTTVFTKPE
jgi:hypothetical protein